MAKKDNKVLLIVGLAVVAGAVLLVTSKPTAGLPAPVAPPGTIPPPPVQSSGGLASWLTGAQSIVNSIFGKSSTPTFAPVGIQPVTSGPPASPAGGITWINPTAPSIPINMPSGGDSSADEAGSTWWDDVFA